MDLAVLLQSIASCLHGADLSSGLYMGLFIAGLVGGFTHCVPMCGVFVLAQTEHLKKSQDALMIPYHLGRMSTYVVLAVLFSSIINAAYLFLPERSMIIAPLLMLAGTIFLISAFPRLRVLFPWAAVAHRVLPLRWITDAVKRMSKSPNMAKKYALGLILGFMPCGLVVAALLAASSAPSMTEAAFAMMAFSAGTMPALIITAFGGREIRARYPRAAQHIITAMMVVSSLWLFAIAGYLIS